MTGSDGSPRSSIDRPWGVIEVVHDIPRIADEWEALADAAQASPFARPGWYAAWWHAFGDQGRFGVVALRGSEGKLRALAPLVRDGAITRSPTNEHTPRFGLLGEDEDALAEMARIMFRLRQQRLSLSPIDVESPSIAALRHAAGEARYKVVERVELRSPYRSLEGVTEADSVLERKMRKDLRRCRRRLEETGQLEVRVERGDGDLEAALQEAFDVEGRGWKGEAGTAIGSADATRGFYAAVARWAADRGSLRLIQLRLDGRTIAFELDILGGGGLHSLKAGFDPEHAKMSPGHLVALAAVEEAIACGARSYELLGDAEPYKLRWADTCHEMRSIEASAPTARGRAEHFKMRVVRPARGRIVRAGSALRSKVSRGDR
jgi:CelD/BcsL family acetyltransferase involved in cellulose biosynthesis